MMKNRLKLNIKMFFEAANLLQKVTKVKNYKIIKMNKKTINFLQKAYFNKKSGKL